MRRRLDAELLRRGLARDAGEALALVRSKRVLVDGAPAENPARQVDSSESISLRRARSNFVGRGGEKLEGALEFFGVDVRGHRALDAGASTGGFTDVLLQRGASEVLALDVGRGQLHERLRRDARVQVLDRTNLRQVGSAELGYFDTVVADLSFISLSSVMPNLADCTTGGGHLILLVKPQFEASREEAGHNGGVIRQAALWRSAIDKTILSGQTHSANSLGVCASPITGAEGNVEFFLHMVKGPASPDRVEEQLAVIDEQITTAIEVGRELMTSPHGSQGSPRSFGPEGSER